jgi:hypothetical protein
MSDKSKRNGPDNLRAFLDARWDEIYSPRFDDITNMYDFYYFSQTVPEEYELNFHWMVLIIYEIYSSELTELQRCHLFEYLLQFICSFLYANGLHRAEGIGEDNQDKRSLKHTIEAQRRIYTDLWAHIQPKLNLGEFPEYNPAIDPDAHLWTIEERCLLGRIYKPMARILEPFLERLKPKATRNKSSPP